jgi:phosphonate transport system permease protein
LATIVGAIVDVRILLIQAINTDKDWENMTHYVVLIVLMLALMDRPACRVGCGAG